MANATNLLKLATEAKAARDSDTAIIAIEQELSASEARSSALVESLASLKRSHASVLAARETQHATAIDEYEAEKRQKAREELARLTPETHEKQSKIRELRSKFGFISDTIAI